MLRAHVLLMRTSTRRVSATWKIISVFVWLSLEVGIKTSSLITFRRSVTLADGLRQLDGVSGIERDGNDFDMRSFNKSTFRL